MDRKLLTTVSLVALALGLTTLQPAPARAADLGGDCCADLEERVAELEATAVKSGNRQMKLTLYGRVNKGLIWFDNGYDSDVYLADMDFAGSRFGIEGTGDLRKGTTVGFKLQIFTQPAFLSGLFEDSNNTTADADSIGIDYAYWNIADETLGTLTVGYADSASDATAEQDLSGSANWFSYNNWATDAVSSFGLIDKASNTVLTDGNGDRIVWSSLLDVLDAGTTANVVRYDTPAFAGFTLSASWGDDDRADAGLTYSYESDHLEVAAAIGYSAVDNGVIGNGPDKTLSTSASLYNPDTGLFVVGAYSKLDQTGIKNDQTDDVNATNWYAKLGIRKDWLGIGETALFVDFQQTDDLFAPGARGRGLGLGVAQTINPIDAVVYAGYRHSSADGLGAPLAVTDMDAVVAGMLVQF